MGIWHDRERKVCRGTEGTNRRRGLKERVEADMGDMLKAHCNLI